MKNIFIFLTFTNFLFSMKALISLEQSLCHQVLPQVEHLYTKALKEDSFKNNKEFKEDVLKFLSHQADLISKNSEEAYEILNIQTFRYSPLLDLKQLITRHAADIVKEHGPKVHLQSYFDCIKTYVKNYLPPATPTLLEISNKG